MDRIMMDMMNSAYSSLSGEGIANIDGVTASTTSDTGSDEQAANTFSRLLHAGTSQGKVETLSPEQMLQHQASLVALTTGVDLGAKIAGAVSQSVNKLANMA